MSEQEIIENNKLIAEFMGYPKINAHIEMWDVEGMATPIVKLTYNSEWGLLMPVVHKCLTICHNYMLNEWENSFADRFMSCSIDLLYSEVVKFISWHKGLQEDLDFKRCNLIKAGKLFVEHTEKSPWYVPHNFCYRYLKACGYEPNKSIEGPYKTVIGLFIAKALEAYINSIKQKQQQDENKESTEACNH